MSRRRSRPTAAEPEEITKLRIVLESLKNVTAEIESWERGVDTAPGDR